MQDAEFIAEGHAFYKALAANNSKDWWSENRNTYDDKLKPFALDLLDRLRPQIAEMMDEDVTVKLFRPYRDTRFSKDKTPYKTHLHVIWQVHGGRQPVAYFFGLEQDHLRIGGGVLGFEKAVLEDWRKFADLDAKRVAGIVEEVEGRGFKLRPPELARAPRGYPVDHPNIRLLRHKSVVAVRPLDANGSLDEAILSGFRDLKPLNDLLLSVACA